MGDSIIRGRHGYREKRIYDVSAPPEKRPPRVRRRPRVWPVALLLLLLVLFALAFGFRQEIGTLLKLPSPLAGQPEE